MDGGGGSRWDFTGFLRKHNRLSRDRIIFDRREFTEEFTLSRPQIRDDESRSFRILLTGAARFGNQEDTRHQKICPFLP